MTDANWSGPWLVFRLGKRLHCVESRAVRAVLSVCSLVPIPFSRPHLRGIFLFRGRVVPVIDPRFLSPGGGKGDDATREAFVVLADHGGFALRVNEVLGVGEDERDLTGRRTFSGRDRPKRPTAIRWRGQEVPLLDPEVFLRGDLIAMPEAFADGGLKREARPAESGRERQNPVPERNHT